jgi:hypothetical protein
MKTSIQVIDELIARQEAREDRYLKQIEASTEARMAREHGPCREFVHNSIYAEEMRRHTLYNDCIGRIGGLLDAKQALQALQASAPGMDLIGASEASLVLVKSK